MTSTQSDHRRAGEALRSYALEDRRGVGPPGLLRAITRAILPEFIRPHVRVWATRLVAPMNRRRAARLAVTRDIRLHLGCGDRRVQGWVNVDLLGTPVNIAWDLSRPLPFEPGVAAAIFHEHLFEHLPLAAGIVLTDECFRMLRPGGWLRICVPDAEQYAKGYALGGSFLEDNRPARPTPMLAMQEVFYLPSHHTMYDFDTLSAVLSAAGFVDIQRSAFGTGRLQPNIDSPNRAIESLYVEARKPDRSAGD